MKRPDTFSTRAAGALGYNDTYYNVPALPSPVAATLLTGAAGATAGHVGGFALDDVVDYKRTVLEAEEMAAKSRGEKLRKDKQFILEMLRMLGGNKYVDKDGQEKRTPFVWSNRFALAGGIAAATPPALMAGSYLGAGHNPFSREAVKWDENYTRPEPKVNIKISPANKGSIKKSSSDRVSGAAPLPKDIFLNDMYSNPYMNYGKKQKIEGIIETASDGNRFIAPMAFGLLNSAVGGSFAAGVLGGTILSYLTGQPKKTKIELQMDGTYNNILNTVF
jgi:hypothetical protein